MNWIHEHPDWPNFSWDDSALSTRLADVRHRQGLLLGRMGSLGFDLQKEASLTNLTSDVVESSAIEGELLDPQEVRSSIARRLGIDAAGLIPSSRHVDGVVEMMLDATQRYSSPQDAQRLFGWHAALFPTGYSGRQRINVGAWRSDSTGPMQVVSSPIGRERLHFEAPSAPRLDAEMQGFLAWFEAPTVTDPIIKAGLAHLWFVTIHPFEDGNGRIARAIADMALARADGRAERFYSMSTQIEAERRVYYIELERQQRSTPDVTPWLNWFLACLGRAIDAAEDSLKSVLHKAQVWKRANLRVINERQRLVLTRLLDGFQGNLTTSKYAKLAKCSTGTALRDIVELVEAGILIRNPGWPQHQLPVGNHPQFLMPWFTRDFSA